MKLVVGLGNPTKKYEQTRHNIGFRAIDFYADLKKLQFKKKFNGLYAQTEINKEKVILLKPQTYMNLSGICVSSFVKYFNISLSDLLVIYDDVDFEVGTYKVKKSGSSSGHNGINNIIESLNTKDVQRLRIGISKPDIILESYVLSKFSKEENEKLDEVISMSANIIEDFATNNIDKLMSKYNGV